MRAYRYELAISLGLLIPVLAVFGWTCRNNFVNYDDELYVYGNPHVRAGLTPKEIGWAFTSFEVANWHPLTWLSLQLDAQLAGMPSRHQHSPGEAAGFHLTNTLFHAANAILLFWSLRVMTGRLWPSAMVAALFAFHPLHVESVAWVAERKDVLSGLFWMLALLAYAWYARAPSVRRYAAVTVAMTLGLIAKPMLVTLPFVFLLLDYWPLGRFPRSRGGKQPRSSSISGGKSVAQGAGAYPITWLVVEKLPLFALTIVSSIVTWLAQSQGQAIRSLEKYPISARLINTVLAYCTYLGQTFWPLNLGVAYPHPAGEFGTFHDIGIPLWQPVSAGVFLLGVSAIAIVTMRGMPYLFVGWFWYIGTLVPVSGLVQVGGQAHADRYTYIPLIGFFVAIVWALADLAVRRRFQKPAIAISVLVIVLLMFQSFVQISYWYDSKELWEHTLQACGESTVAHTNLAKMLFESGLAREAEEHARRAVEIDPGNHPARMHHGVLLFELGRRKEAVAEFERLLRQHPDLAEAHFNFALCLLQMDERQQGELHLQKAFELARGSGHAGQLESLQQRLEQFQAATKHKRPAGLGRS